MSTKALTREGSAGARRAWNALTRRCPRAPPMLVLILVVATLDCVTVRSLTQVSEIDERYWIEHLVQGSRFEIAQFGEPLNQETVRELCTRRADWIKDLPPCTPGVLDAQAYSFWQGVNIARHSPFYFFATGPVARALRATPIDLPPDDSLVTWARLLGAAWLLLGWYFVLRIGDILGVDRRWLVVAMAMLSATPALLHASTIVNPDQTALPVGAAIMFAALAWERSGKGLWGVGLTVLAGAALDPTNSVVILALLVYLAIRAVLSATGREADDAMRRSSDYAKVAVIAVVSAILATRGWSWIELRLFTDPVPPGLDVSANPIGQFYSAKGHVFRVGDFLGIDVTRSFFPPFTDAEPRAAYDHVLYSIFTTFAGIVTIGSLVAVMLRERFTRRLRALSAATVAALLASPGLIVFYFYAVDGTFDSSGPPPARWALSAFPLIAVILAGATRIRLFRPILAVATLGLFAAAIYVVLR